MLLPMKDALSSFIPIVGEIPKEKVPHRLAEATESFGASVAAMSRFHHPVRLVSETSIDVNLSLWIAAKRVCSALRGRTGRRILK